MDISTTIIALLFCLILMIIVALYYGYTEYYNMITVVHRHDNDIKVLMSHVMYEPTIPKPVYHQTPSPQSYEEMNGGGPHLSNDDVIVHDVDSDDEYDTDDENFEDEAAMHEEAVVDLDDDEEVVVEETAVDEDDDEEEVVEETAVDDTAVDEDDDEEEVVAAEELEAVVEPVALTPLEPAEVDEDLFLEVTKKSGTPDEPAKNYDDGYEMVSPHNGDTYYVKSDKNGRKRWSKRK